MHLSSVNWSWGIKEFLKRAKDKTDINVSLYYFHFQVLVFAVGYIFNFMLNIFMVLASIISEVEFNRCVIMILRFCWIHLYFVKNKVINCTTYIIKVHFFWEIQFY